MADNTRQARWIITLYNNLRGLFQGKNVFVAADLFWYPVEGEPRVVAAPDVMVALGRPDRDRPSYQQWKEEGVAPQVVFEVLSPSNTPLEMMAKLTFYQKYGVEEFIVIDPGREEGDPERFVPHVRRGDQLTTPDFPVVDWTSPRLQVRFHQSEGSIQAFYPDGSPFLSFEAIRQQLSRTEAQLAAEKQRADAAEAELARLRKQWGQDAAD